MAPELLALWQWDETRFLKATEGSAIRRIGFEKWQRNLAVALGNAPYCSSIVDSLRQRSGNVTPLVQEHLEWAITQQEAKRANNPRNPKTERLIRCIQKGMPDHA